MFSHRLKRGSHFLLILTLTVLSSIAEKKEIQAEETAARQRVYRRQKRKTTGGLPPRETGGLRGGQCNLLPPEIVTAIVPLDHIGTTTSARPTVLWFSKQNITRPVRITFYSPGDPPILVKNFSGIPKGFGAFRIPDETPGLEMGKLYKWTITIVCNEKRPSNNLYAQGLIERVPLSMKQRSDSFSCNVDFASLGIWYDAISCSYSQLNLREDYSNFYLEDFNALIEQIGLSEFKVSGGELLNADLNLE